MALLYVFDNATFTCDVNPPDGHCRSFNMTNVVVKVQPGNSCWRGLMSSTNFIQEIDRV